MGNISDLATNLSAVRGRLAAACAAAGRAETAVRLVAVSKGFGADAVRAAHAAGQREFGENYLQEAVGKITQLEPLRPIWHFIGPIQSNKTAEIAERFDWVQSVDRLKIARRLSAQRPPELPALNLCVQVNISSEASKSGCAPADAAGLCAEVAKLPRLKLRGLMAIPAPAEGLEAQRAPYRALRALLESLRRAGFELDTLSAGMSDDLEAAIAEGSTLVRVGTAVFGKRKT